MVLFDDNFLMVPGASFDLGLFEAASCMIGIIELAEP